jgi:UDP-2,3-diacylglucosamine pyrophosphatase LpxH
MKSLSTQYDRRVTGLGCHIFFIDRLHMSEIDSVGRSFMKADVFPRHHYRAIFISDIHLGSKRAQTKALLDFLRETESERLYLVGDIIDSWSLRSKWYWDQLHNDVIQKILRKARKGTKVIFIPGNHDENFRDIVGHRFGRVAVMREAVHKSATGKRYLVLHGDKFDNVIYFAPWLGKLGDWAYERLMDLNGPVNALRRLAGFGQWSLSAYIKLKVKKAVEFISRFETVVVREAHERRCQGAICGHIHTPDDRMIDGIHYLNDGDWVESCTALVEHRDGRFEIIRWQHSLPQAIRAVTLEPERVEAEKSELLPWR